MRVADRATLPSLSRGIVAEAPAFYRIFSK
jgi:hypothetical protein